MKRHPLFHSRSFAAIALAAAYFATAPGTVRGDDDKDKHKKEHHDDKHDDKKHSDDHHESKHVEDHHDAKHDSHADMLHRTLEHHSEPEHKVVEHHSEPEHKVIEHHSEKEIVHHSNDIVRHADPVHRDHTVVHVDSVHARHFKEAHPRYKLVYGNGYRGRGYYYGPPGVTYYDESPDIEYYSSRDEAPQEYYSDNDNGPDNSPSRSTDSPSSDNPVAAVQAALARKGYYNGAVDGETGPMTVRAISRYQSENDLKVTGDVNNALLRSLGID